MDKFEAAALWLLTFFAAFVAASARLAWLLFGPTAADPPEDPVQLAAWKRKRHWVTISEFAALPAFATGWVAAGMCWTLPVPLVVLGSMASGALGFGFLLNALHTIVLRRVEAARISNV
ncbi:MAG TPA: hypothetical protein VF680_11720 [Allosphingosinicella sp.]|jgi:hypothetical protein